MVPMIHGSIVIENTMNMMNNHAMLRSIFSNKLKYGIGALTIHNGQE
jgi:hypothetical protein